MSFALGNDNDKAPRTNRSKQTNFPQVCKSKLKLVLDVPVKKFKEIVEINIDPHKFLDNFRLMKKYLEECQRHHIGTFVFQF